MTEALRPTNVLAGTITAPAGCGKTHIVAESIAEHDENALPLLVLTHTNAGVAALRKRVEKLGVSPKKARISTLDGWSLKLLSSFPKRSGIDPAHLKLENRAVDYPAIRQGALKIIEAGHLSSILKSTYSHLIVDEYQDCQPDQHRMVVGLAKELPTCVLGDPLQSIFNFTEEGTVDWEEDVLATFPNAGTLDVPWRWKLAKNDELGEWLLSIRDPLLAGQKIDLRKAPDCVEWIELDGANDWPKQLSAANTRSPVRGGGSLIMAKWPQDQAKYARNIPGASKVENADLTELLEFASSFVPAEENSLGSLVSFAASVMTGIDRTALSQRLTSIQNGTNRNPPTDLENAIFSYADDPTYLQAAVILSEFSRQSGTRTFRQELLRTAIQALNSAHEGSEKALKDLATSIRDQMRFVGRTLPNKAVGSTLLFKGLEADVSIILEANKMDYRDLYVALTRGSRKLVVCSASPLLPVR